MSTDRSPTDGTYRSALLIPLEQSTPDYLGTPTSPATRQEAGPIITDVVTTTTSSRLALEALGSWETETPLEFMCLRGGNPGRSSKSAGMGWRGLRLVAPFEDWRGRNVPNVIQTWEPIRWTAGGGSHGAIDETSDPDVAPLSDGTLATVVQTETATAVSGGKYHVSVYVRDPVSGWASTPTHLYTSATAPTHGFRPCVAVDEEDDTLYVLHWVEDADAEEAQVWMHYSTDGGATWVAGGRWVLPEAIDISSSGFYLGKLSAGVADGDMLLMAEVANRAGGTPTYVSEYYQYASNSHGAGFDLVEYYDASGVGAAPYGRFAVVVVDGVFYVLHAGGSSSNDEGLYMHVLATPWDPFSTAREVEINGNPIAGNYSATTGYTASASDIAATVDYDGVIYVLNAYTDNGGYYDAIMITRSDDEGETWTPMGASSIAGIANAGVIWRCGSNSIRPRRLALAPQRGRLALVANLVSSAGTYDGSLICMYLGGWTNVTMPGLSLFPAPDDRAGWVKTFVPMDAPTSMGWTAGGSGKTGSHTSDGGWQLDSTAGTLYYYDNPTATQAQGIGAEFVVDVQGSPTTVSTEHGLVLRLADSTDDYQISVRVGTDAITVYDDNTGPATLLGTISLETQDSRVHVRAELRAGEVLVIARTWSASEDCYWSDSVQSSALTNDTSSPAANNLRQWGAIATSSTGSTWYEVKGTEGPYLGVGQAAGFTNPDDLYAGPLSAVPYPYAGNVWLYATRGPARYGDEAELPVDYTHAARFAFPQIVGSTSRRLRTKDTATDLDITIELHPSADVEVPPALACFVITNARTHYFEGYTGGGWVTLVTGDAAYQRAGSYALAGDRCWPAAGTGWNQYIEPHSLAGCTAELVNGGTTKLREVAGNQGGLWDAAKDGQQELLRFYDADGTEPSTGTLRVWAKQLAMIFHPTGTKYQKLRLRVPAQSTLSGDFRIKVMFCEVQVAGVPSGARWIRTLEHGTELETAPDRTGTAYKLAEPIETIEIPWMDLLPTHHIEGAAADPGYLTMSTAGGARPAANWGSVVSQQRGAIRRLQGPLTPVVLVIGPTRSGATSEVITDPRRLHYSRITSEVREERVNAWGSRLRGLVLRGEP